MTSQIAPSADRRLERQVRCSLTRWQAFVPDDKPWTHSSSANSGVTARKQPEVIILLLAAVDESSLDEKEDEDRRAVLWFFVGKRRRAAFDTRRSKRRGTSTRPQGAAFILLRSGLVKRKRKEASPKRAKAHRKEDIE